MPIENEECILLKRIFCKKKYNYLMIVWKIADGRIILFIYTYWFIKREQKVYNWLILFFLQLPFMSLLRIVANKSDKWKLDLASNEVMWW